MIDNDQGDSECDDIGCTTELVAVRIHRAKEKLRKLGGREPWKGKLACLMS